jgi:hypothetical protein
VTEDWGFARAADMARTVDESFELAWITVIEAAWQTADLDHGMFGFVLAMADGRRLYWLYTSDDAEAGRPEDFDSVELAAGETPTAPEGARWYDPARLNGRLAVMRRFA